MRACWISRVRCASIFCCPRVRLLADFRDFLLLLAAECVDVPPDLDLFECAVLDVEGLLADWDAGSLPALLSCADDNVVARRTMQPTAEALVIPHSSKRNICPLKPKTGTE